MLPTYPQVHLLFCLVVLVSCDHTVSYSNDTKESLHADLVDFLLKKAKTTQRPIVHPLDKLVIHVFGALYQIVDVDQRNNLATISAYFDLWWKDPFLTWNPDEFDGTEEMYLPTSRVWTPELYLYHSIEGSIPLHLAESAVQVQYTGKVRTFVPFTARALCPINVKYFPFDKQKCNFTFGSWSYRAESVEYNVSSPTVFLDDFFDNQEWVLLSCVLLNGQSRYNTGFTNETYSTVIMEIEIDRQSFYYVFNLVFPTTLVSITAVLGFHAPANSSPRRESKYRLGIMTLLSMGVMLLMVVDQMPKFSLASIPGQRGSFSDVPLLGIFYLELILIISICTCTTSVFVLMERYALRNPDIEDVPYLLRLFDFDWPWSQKCREKRNSGFTSSKKKKLRSDVGFASDMSDVQKNNGGIQTNTISEKVPLTRIPMSAPDKYHNKHRQNNLSSEENSDPEHSTLPIPVENYASSPRLTFSPQRAASPTRVAISPAENRRVGSYRRTWSSQGVDPVTDKLLKYFQTSCDTMHIIGQRMLQIQTKMDVNTNTLLYGHKGRGGLSSRVQGREPTLAPWWHRIIRRLESISLTFYLLCIIMAFVLFFFPIWWY